MVLFAYLFGNVLNNLAYGNCSINVVATLLIIITKILKHERYQNCHTSIYLCCCCLVTKSCLTLLGPHGLWGLAASTWDFPGKNSRVDCHFLIQGIFLTQESKPHLLLGRWILTTEPLGISVSVIY